MMKYWLNVSYMVELICACLLFLKPVRKRKHFVLGSLSDNKHFICMDMHGAVYCAGGILFYLCFCSTAYIL